MLYLVGHGNAVPLRMVIYLRVWEVLLALRLIQAYRHKAVLVPVRYT
jgi:hypothetical protein